MAKDDDKKDDPPPYIQPAPTGGEPGQPHEVPEDIRAPVPPKQQLTNAQFVAMSRKTALIS